MRIAADFRMLSGGANVVNRGTGRYTQHQLREVLRIDRENEYFVVCHQQADASLLLPEIRRAPNCRVIRLSSPELTREAQPNHPERALRNNEILQDFFYQHQIDLFHATTPYQLDELVPTAWDVCPYVATLYDLIPLIYPNHYWPAGTPFHEELLRAYDFMERADRLIAISQSARFDATTHLGIDPARIDIAYPVADPMFRVLDDGDTERALADLRRRIGLRGPYILSVAHIHHTKNLETLLAAYAQLPAATRAQYPLVIVFFLRDSDKALLSALTDKYGVTSNVLLTGLVSDEELVALYNGAQLVAHPSRYEGFGLPVVEAMQCGTPVVTTTASSLPEVAGDAAILVHPEDVDGLYRGLPSLLEDQDLRADLARRGLDNVKRFNDEQLGAQTLASYKTVLDGGPKVGARPRVAMWTTLPPKPCGIADHTVDFITEMSDHAALEFFVDGGYLPERRFLREHTVHHHSAYERRRKQAGFSSTVFQFGVSFMHDFMYAAIRKYRGVVAIHDVICAANLHYVLNERGRMNEFESMIVAAEGAEAERAYRRAKDDPERRDEVFQQHWFLKWIIDASDAQIVHMPFARAELERRYPEARVHFVPLTGIVNRHRLSTWSKKLMRHQMGLRPSTLVIGAFGTVARLKRLEACLLAFAELVKKHPNSALLISGNHDYDPGYTQELRELAERLGLTERVRFLGHAPDDRLADLIDICDVVLNLRYPSKIQMSGTLSRALAAGKPVIFSDIPEWRFIPDDCSYKIPVDDSEVPRLSNVLTQLALDPLLLADKSRSARAFYQSTFTSAAIAEEYARILGLPTERRQADPAPSPSDARPITRLWGPEGGAARSASLWAGDRAVETLERAGLLDRPSRVLVLGAGAEPVVFQLTGLVGEVLAVDDYLGSMARHPEMLIQPERATTSAFEPERLRVSHMPGLPLRVSDGSCDAVIVLNATGALRNGEIPAAPLLSDIHRVLKPDGIASLTVDLVLNGPPDRDLIRPAPLQMTREGLQQLLEATGFAPVDGVPADTLAAALLAPRRQPLSEEDPRYPPQYVETRNGYAVGRLHVGLRRLNAPVSVDDPTPQRSFAPELSGSLLDDLLETTAIGESGAYPTRHSPAGGPRSSEPKTASIMSDIRAHLAQWEAIRLKGWYNRYLKRLPKALGALVRTFIRVVYLGHSQSAEKQIFSDLVALAEAQQSQLEGERNRSIQLEARMAQLVATASATDHKSIQETQRRIADLQQSLESQSLTMERMQEALEATTSQAASLQNLQQALESQLQDVTARTEGTREVTESLRASRDSDYERLSLAIGQIRLLQQDVASVKTPHPSKPERSISGPDLVELVRQIEQQHPELASRQRVEVSVEGAQREELVLALSRWYGSRLSGRGTEYRAPNDLYVDVRLGEASVGAQSLDGGIVSKLGVGAHVVVICDWQFDINLPETSFLLQFDLTLTTRQYKDLHIRIWKHSPSQAPEQAS